jgi:hypothetical protein
MQLRSNACTKKLAFYPLIQNQIMKHFHFLLLAIFITLYSCSKENNHVKPVGEMATIDSVWAHKISDTEYAVEIDITVKDTSLTGLELYMVPGALVGRIDNPRTGHYTITAGAFPNPNLYAYRFNLTTSSWRYELPIFYMGY